MKFNKGFINNHIFKGKIDHGNHFPNMAFKETELILVHYHLRSKIQIEKKVENNIIGLGYKNDLISLEKLLLTPNIRGGHHIKNRIKMINNTFIYEFNFKPNRNTTLLTPIKNIILEQ